MNFGEKIKAIRVALDLTQDEFAARLGTTKQAISRYENSEREPNLRTAREFSKKLGVDLTVLADDSMALSDRLAANIIPMPSTYKVPLIGTIACGKPTLAVEEADELVEVPDFVRADFALRCKGDSMINARIFDGDVVYIRKQPEVENGEIAAVLIEDEATLKRVAVYPDKIVLEAANPLYDPLVYRGEEMNQVEILGKAVGFTSLIS